MSAHPMPLPPYANDNQRGIPLAAHGALPPQVLPVVTLTSVLFKDVAEGVCSWTFEVEFKGNISDRELSNCAKRAAECMFGVLTDREGGRDANRSLVRVQWQWGNGLPVKSEEQIPVPSFVSEAAIQQFSQDIRQRMIARMGHVRLALRMPRNVS